MAVRTAPSLLLAVVLAVGCGGREPTRRASAAPRDPGTLRCLSAAGARLAYSRRDIGFFFDALTRKQAQHPGSTFTNRWSLVVDEWESAPGSTLTWQLWAAQPVHPGHVWSVQKVLSVKPPGWYVAYIVHPTDRSLRSVDRCLLRVQLGRGRPVTQAPRRPGTARFHALRVDAHVIPPSGGVHTAFRVRISVRQPLGVAGRVLRGYEAHLLKTGPAGPCIIDTDGFVTAGRPGEQIDIVLDPAQQKGSQWCPGTFRGALRYYEAYPCPAGKCAWNTRENSAIVSRIAFRVGGRTPY